MAHHTVDESADSDGDVPSESPNGPVAARGTSDRQSDHSPAPPSPTTTATGESEKRYLRDLAYDLVAEAIGARPPQDAGRPETAEQRAAREQRRGDLTTILHSLLKEVLTGARIVVKVASGVFVAWLVSWGLGLSVSVPDWLGRSVGSACGLAVWAGWLWRAVRRRGWHPMRRIRSVFRH